MVKNQYAENISVLDNIKLFSDVTKTLFFIIVCVLSGLVLIVLQKDDKDIATLIFWSLACLASGGVVGFLFGIPRVLQDNPEVALKADNAVKNNKSSTADTDGGANGAAPLSYRIMVNTNLEQISDWLTKIIVGLGLIELRNVPGHLNSLSTFFSAGLGGTKPAQSLASAIIVYFVIVGFLGVYLMTRIYLAQVFSKADRGTQDTAVFGGKELTLQEVSEQLFKKVTDVEDEVLNVRKPSGNTKALDTAAGGRDAEPKPKVKLILWVDDNPVNNGVHIQRLNEMGIKVVTSTSTNDALAKVKTANFDRIISNMSRKEEKGFNERAGLDLFETLKSQDIHIPFLILCGDDNVKKYGQEAYASGVSIITSSSTDIIKTLQGR